ncbi:hypothetical protein SDJN03_02709, partial [Cucurbita argyrosperma subsp. sororia]
MATSGCRQVQDCASVACKQAGVQSSFFSDDDLFQQSVTHRRDSVAPWPTSGETATNKLVLGGSDLRSRSTIRTFSNYNQQKLKSFLGKNYWHQQNHLPEQEASPVNLKPKFTNTNELITL